MMNVGLQSRVVNQYIIQKNQNEFAQKWAKYLVHKMLEGGWCIGEVERHDLVTIMRSKGCF
jgi:hypothetical protein